MPPGPCREFSDPLSTTDHFPTRLDAAIGLLPAGTDATSRVRCHDVVLAILMDGTVGGMHITGRLLPDSRRYVHVTYNPTLSTRSGHRHVYRHPFQKSWKFQNKKNQISEVPDRSEHGRENVTPKEKGNPPCIHP